MTDAQAVFIKTTLDGRKVEVIGGCVCLDGRPEADTLVLIDEHPNRSAILQAVPKATHVAGRLPLTMAEASITEAALREVHDAFDGSVRAAEERMRKVLWQKAMSMDGAGVD